MLCLTPAWAAKFITDSISNLLKMSFKASLSKRSTFSKINLFLYSGKLFKNSNLFSFKFGS